MMFHMLTSYLTSSTIKKGDTVMENLKKTQKTVSSTADINSDVRLLKIYKNLHNESHYFFRNNPISISRFTQRVIY